jgi:LuxR family maltose regulon positive regulatory protein
MWYTLASQRAQQQDESERPTHHRHEVILLRTRLNRPAATGDFVARPRLVQKLNAGLTRKLTLISAPAGFGKSTLAASWQSDLEASAVDGRIRCAWLSCDEDDNTLVHFLTYVIGAVRTAFPGALARTEALLQAPALPPVDYLAQVILYEIGGLSGDFFLTLDDYHAVTDGDVHRLVALILAGAPPGAHLTLISRRDPPLPLARLRVQQQLVEIRAADLRFQPVEVDAFLRNNLGRSLTPDAVARLEDQTEGWIAALRLAALSMQEMPQPEAVVDALAAARRPAMEFLGEQVLAQQGEEMRDFLLRSAILERMNGELCDAVLCGDAAPPGTCGRDWLEQIERSNLFLIPLDTEGEWYRYHHLFRDFLRSHLERACDPAEIAGLHRRAARWFAEKGVAEEAIRHYLAAGDPDCAAAIAEKHTFDLVNAERLAAAEQLLALLPEPITHPALLVARCWTLIFRWRIQSLTPTLAEAAAALPAVAAASPTSAARLAAHIDALASLALLFAQDDPASSAQRAQAALDRLARSDTHAYFTAMLTLGVALNRLGRRDEALARLRGELARALDGDHAGAFRQLIGISTIHLHSTNLDRLGDSATSLLELGLATGRYNSITFAHYYLGCQALLQGDPLAAAGQFGRVVEQRYLANAKIYQDSLHGLALARQALGEADAAREAALAALAFAAESLTPRDTAESRSILTRLALLRGDDPRRLALHDPPPAFAWNAYIEMPALTHARLLLARGAPADLLIAAEYLAQAQAANRAANDDRRLVEGLALEARANHLLGRRAQARDLVREALALAGKSGYALPFLEAGAEFAVILADLPDVAASPIGRRLSSGAARERQTRPTVRQQGDELLETLTNREEEVLLLLARRLSDKEIGEALTISPLTAHKHVSNILAKLGVNSRRQAALKARALGLIPPE